MTPIIIGCVAGLVITVAGVALCCAVSAGRAEREMERMEYEADHEEKGHDGI